MYEGFSVISIINATSLGFSLRFVNSFNSPGLEALLSTSFVYWRVSTYLYPMDFAHPSYGSLRRPDPAPRWAFVAPTSPPVSQWPTPFGMKRNSLRRWQAAWCPEVSKSKITVPRSRYLSESDLQPSVSPRTSCWYQIFSWLKNNQFQLLWICWTLLILKFRVPEQYDVQNQVNHLPRPLALWLPRSVSDTRYGYGK